MWWFLPVRLPGRIAPDAIEFRRTLFKSISLPWTSNVTVLLCAFDLISVAFGYNMALRLFLTFGIVTVLSN